MARINESKAAEKYVEELADGKYSLENTESCVCSDSQRIGQNVHTALEVGKFIKSKLFDEFKKVT